MQLKQLLDAAHMHDPQYLNYLEDLHDDWLGCLGQVCSRLFRCHPGEQPPLRYLTPTQVRSFRSNGFVIVDGFLGTDVCARLRREALSLHDQGAQAYRNPYQGLTVAKV